MKMDKILTYSFILFTNISTSKRLDKYGSPKYVKVWKYDSSTPDQLEWFDSTAKELLIIDSQKEDSTEIESCSIIHFDLNNQVMVQLLTTANPRIAVENRMKAAKNKFIQ
jgi:hypothetical protein